MSKFLFITLFSSAKLFMHRPSPDDAYDDGGGFILWLPIALAVLGAIAGEKYWKHGAMAGGVAGALVGCAAMFFYYEYVLMAMLAAWVIGAAVYIFSLFADGEIGEGITMAIFFGIPQVLFGSYLLYYMATKQ